MSDSATVTRKKIKSLNEPTTIGKQSIKQLSDINVLIGPGQF